MVELLGGGLRVTLMQTQMSPAAAMSGWLSEKEPPWGFTIDRECELKQPDSEKSAVRYSRHVLEIDEVGEHIRQGKLPTQLALTWNGRVSFVLNDQGALKKIKLLDVVLEGQEKKGEGDNGFDADVAIMTGELRQMIPDLIEALGGWLDPNKPAPAPSSEGKAPAERAGADTATVAEASESETPPWVA
jgi:recombination associated protein RdgC